ncbi:metal ABC transporter permease [Arcanobacterium ihumii]|uniref:metal ABC transporter permease n=1 Tax=Arcanobacterium ihumii TaxID=2138162 RepID=UPI000F54864B|nr:metal ABC transporter permease [Arcanobacterium ihumii]
MFDVLFLPTIEIVLVGILCGLVGVLAILRRQIFFAESVTHGTFPGAVIGVVIGNHLSHSQSVLSAWLFVGALLGCIILTLLMNRLSSIPQLSSQATAGIVLTFGFSLGYFLNKWFSPLPLNIESFLAGSLLHVTIVDVIVTALVLLIVIVGISLALPRLTYFLFDDVGFSTSGHDAKISQRLILSAIVATMVVVVPAIGTVLSISLLAAPAASAKPFTKSVGHFLITSTILGVVIGIAGLTLAVIAKLSAGGSIATLAGVVYLASRMLATLRR